MFFKVFNRAILCAGIFALTACGGGEPSDTPTSTMRPGRPSASQQTPADAAPAHTGTPGGAQRVAPLVSAAERDAEQLRMLPYEQSFSMEMQRRAQERPEHLRAELEAAPAQPASAQPASAQATPAQATPAQATRAAVPACGAVSAQPRAVGCVAPQSGAATPAGQTL